MEGIGPGVRVTSVGRSHVRVNTDHRAVLQSRGCKPERIYPVLHLN